MTVKNTEDSFIKYYRHWANINLFPDEKYTQREAYTDLHLRKYYQDVVSLYNGQMIKIQKGQIPCSAKSLGVAWGWSISTVNRFLKKLKDNNLIHVYTPYGFSIIEMIENTKKPQDPKNFPATFSEDGEIIPDDKPIVTGQIKPDEADIINEQFDELWKTYKPTQDKKTGKVCVKGNKSTARTSFRKAIVKDKVDFQEIMKGLRVYLNQCHSHNIYTQHVATWINQQGWDIDDDTGGDAISYSDEEHQRLMAMYGGNDGK